MGKFLADTMVGRLARWLRVLGYDVIYTKKGIDSKLIIQAYNEGRIILTRNRKLFKKIGTKGAVFIDFDNFLDQICEVIRILGLDLEEEAFFTRCLDCNFELIPINRQEAEKKVPPFVYHTQDAFRTCPKCKRIFWSGTHIGGMKKMINEFLTKKDKG